MANLFNFIKNSGVLSGSHTFANFMATPRRMYCESVRNAFVVVGNAFAVVRNAFALVRNAFALVRNVFALVRSAFVVVRSAFALEHRKYAELLLYGDSTTNQLIYITAFTIKITAIFRFRFFFAQINI